MSQTIFRVKGYRFYFLSNEETRIHVHVTAEKGEAKYWLEPKIMIALSHGFGKEELNEIQKLIREHKDEIATAWVNHFH